MILKELEKAIENEDTVWVANKYCEPYGVQLTKDNYYIGLMENKESLLIAHLDDTELVDYLEYIFKTKKEAEDYSKCVQLFTGEKNDSKRN